MHYRPAIDAHSPVKILMPLPVNMLRIYETNKDTMRKQRAKPAGQTVCMGDREEGKVGQRLPLQTQAGAVVGSRAPAGKLDSRLHCRIGEQILHNVSGRDAAPGYGTALRSERSSPH